MHEDLLTAIVEMKEQEAIQLTRNMINSGLDPVEVLNVGTTAMDVIGKRFENGEYFLPHLIMAGEMLKQMADIIKPLIKESTKDKSLGKVLIGTVSGDVHDIGKDIVAFLLDVNGFEVKDLGIDVPVEDFLEAVKQFQPQVVALSGLLTVANASMKSTIEAITEAGLRDQVKIMIGGAQASDIISEYAGADAYGKDAFEGVVLAKQWICGD
jgi:methanogenic corrinoid protein MtbC1